MIQRLCTESAEGRNDKNDDVVRLQDVIVWHTARFTGTPKAKPLPRWTT